MVPNPVQAQHEILYDTLWTPKVEEKFIERIKSFLLARKELDIGLNESNTEALLSTCNGILPSSCTHFLVEEDFFREKLKFMEERYHTYKWLLDLKELNSSGNDVFFATSPENWAHLIAIKPLARAYVEFGDPAMLALINIFDVPNADKYIRWDWDDFEELSNLGNNIQDDGSSDTD